MAYNTLKALGPRENLTEKYKKDRAALEKDFQKHLDEWKQTAVMVVNLAKKYGDREQLHHKPYGQWETFTWNQVSEIMFAVAGALLNSGLKEGDRTGIFSPNRAEWHLSDLGSQLVRCVPVPIYATNTEKEVEYLVNDAEIKVLFTGRQMHYDRSYALLDKCPSLEKIVVFHRGTKIHDDKRVVMWDDFLEEGRKAGRKAEIEEIMGRAHYDDMCTIIYTSGTTGEPKGAVHTHKTLMQNSWGVGRYVEGCFTDNDSDLCMLPLTHVLQRSWDYGIFSMGMQIWYCEDHNQILEYLVEANPTVMNGAPRIFEKIYSTLYTKIKEASPVKQKIFHWSVGVGKQHGDKVLAGKQPGPWLSFKRKIADKLVLHKIRDLFGKNMHHVNYGGAALNPEIERFFFNCGMLVVSGYGLTETSPVISMNGPHCFKFGSIGPASPLVDIRIDPETGEIQAKGPNIFKEYYKKPDKTKEAFTDDGWFRTGDIGRFDDDGYLYITDRLKDLIITSGGKNIAPQMIELMMAEDHFIEYIAVVGDGRKYITALVVPSFENLEDWAKKNGVPFSSREDLIKDPKVIAYYRQIIDKRQKDLGQVEQIKRFTLLAKEFSQETGEITPTMKVKRKVVQEKYKELIDAMYVE
ncbi:MAG TPA: long-chain fatty acid--CoA ligase [Spirochaetota bacterium]|nr:long-chain fatty acid--CoA ligase [Spirochaetota bacterium]HPF06428.1 long-chain fatty acid--CoA ligase [Spirochaetota bacterium]HPJ41648.1 long-chain fatty acid--CoA ligase [Spirochaetota bacterium]HPR36680.1 long-chain fatty acid--CoA ligase [Spirochaetota bacterium]HRX47092.1 long-chain fatty acid--CoA ligase [Spirochaetota bacterium]